MRRSIPFLAVTLSAEVVGALLTGTAPASADPMPTPDPVVEDAGTAPPRTGHADEPPPVAIPSTDEPITDAPTTDAPTVDPVIDNAPALPIRTGRAGDPAAVTATVGATEAQPAGTPAAAATTPPAAPHPAAPAPAPTARVAGVPMVPAEPATTSSYTVARGDNLWEIAAVHLAVMTGRARAGLATSEINAYWLRVCVANRARVHSGNVNLIYSGEVIELPPL